MCNPANKMDEVFSAHIDALRPKLEGLISMVPVKPGALPRHLPTDGVYLMSEGDRHLYVGRSNDIRGRIGRHCRLGATHRMAAFTFRLAREKTENFQPYYKKGEGSRDGLMENEEFVRAFTAAKTRIRAMDLRFVEESNPVRQTLLKIYVAVVLATPYNDFDTH